MIGGSPEQVERQIEDWAQQAEQKAQRYQQMSAAVSAVSATESSPDGVVKVTVNASGAMSALELTDRIREQSGSAVAAQIMACVQRAQAKLAGQVAAAMQATIGDEQSTIDTVVSGYEQRFPEPVSPATSTSPGYKRIGELEDDTPPPPVERRQPQRRPRDEDDDFDGGSYLR
ncbi:YbaB/EbfC DNA-binding family protein [Lentzea fradiae]|uniref:YbaB/EbfC DNA-binding family protein n=1 Tax=Lentzea fradiae TaxID=200378 RepID=A0A1G7SFR5_9PSEU|nr:YbaB/EbfC family nucleoid-associated protein [Lentzea fradiae]SDG21050.1 YbaB/EbfC DNA-binding family protein [Lentzea fradiae]